jgi:hypothetical protein
MPHKQKQGHRCNQLIFFSYENSAALLCKNIRHIFGAVAEIKCQQLTVMH